MSQPISANPSAAQNLADSWESKAGYGVQNGNAPLIIAGDRLIGCFDTSIYAINIYTGETLTGPQDTSQPGFPIVSAAQAARVVNSNGAVYFPGTDADGNSVLQGSRLVDGLPLPATTWPSPAIGTIHSLSADGDHIIIVAQAGDGDTNACAIDARDGSTKWGPITITQDSAGAIGYGDGAIFLVSDQQLYAVNTDFGDTRFPRPLAHGAVAPTYDINPKTAPLLAAPAGDLGAVVCVGSKVWAFEARTGIERWAFAVEDDDFNGVAPVALSDDGTLVAVVSTGNMLYVLDAAEGHKKWQQQLSYAGSPVIAGDRVFVCGSGQQVIASFGLAEGSNGKTYALGTDVSAVPPVIGNGHIYIQDTAGVIHAKPYASQSAAHFNGSTASIEIAADAGQFDFGGGDFTIEAWIRSCEGGEILCGYPTDKSGAGFRLNLSERGEFRFAVTDLANANQDLAKSRPTRATDGFWHHIAVVRRNGEISFFTDTIAQSPASRHIRSGKAKHANGYALDQNGRRRRDLLTQPPKPAPIAITGGNTLYIGWDQHGDKTEGKTPYHFTGLMREVRLWNKALDAATIKSRQQKVLGPKGTAGGGDVREKANEPQLLGNWHLDETYNTDQPPTAIVNDVLGHEFAATFHSPRAVITDLDLDLSAFPYLLDRMDLQWPYAGVWSTRGEDDITTPAALSSDGYLCFGTNNSLYGVRRLDGGRQWGLPKSGHSLPVASGKSFYVQTIDRGIVAIEAAFGVPVEVLAFKNLPTARDKQGHLSAPAASGDYLAAAAQDGGVWIGQSSGPEGSSTPTFATDRYPGDLQFAGTMVGCVAGERTSLNLFAYDTARQVSFKVPVDSRTFTLCGGRVFCTQDDKLVVIDTSKQETSDGYRFVASSVAAADITGLAAESDSNILVVSTTAGRLYGLSMATLMQRWCATIADGAASGPGSTKGHLNAPTIADRVVYCTGRSGAVAALEAASGRLLGLFFEPTAVITPALVQAGTAFFGCASAAPTAPLDGALHSVVFGDTVALRVGIDAFGKRTSGGYAAVPRDKPLFVDDDGACCVEAWINAEAASDATGGEILSIPAAAKSNVGLRLFLDSDGKIHFIGHAPKADAGWDGVHARTLHPTSVRDGQWHHIAVSRGGARDVRIYVDGKQQEIDALGSDPIEQDALAGDTFEIRIGAPAYQALPGADANFHGLIADVRLWNTYLPADQISSRMHTKLRGDEFSLLAFWDFNRASVHDAARNGYDGKLVPADSANSATFWLCDPTFAEPDYPDVTTTARIVETGEDITASGTQVNDYAGTTYELTIACTKADRSPLPGALLRLWYVKHPGEQQLETITLVTAGVNPADTPSPPVVSTQDVHPVPADQEGTPDHPGFVVYTDAKGLAIVNVHVARGDHGPSFDLAADFMPANERFPVNVLIDSQALARPLPPSLMVQTKLIQDYAYSPGNKIDGSRSRDTYRAVITALNADHSPRAREWLEISALDYTTIEVGGKSYEVNPHNAQSFQADVKGQLTVVVAAADIKTADLSVWAGFMHQGERVTIALDQDAHQTMSDPDKVNGTKMNDPARLKNWRTDKENGPEIGALLKDGYQDHAEKVADAIRHVASATQPSPPAPPLGAVQGNDRLPAMKQPIRPTYGDRGQALRTLKHVQRRIPVTPESVLASIRRASKGDHVGFYMSFGGGTAADLEFGHFTADDADHHMGRLLPPQSATRAGMPVGLGVSDFCDECESLADQAVDAAKEAAEAAQKLAVEITDKVTVAIQYVDSVVNIVVNSIAEAMEVIGTFLEKIALLVVQFIKFLLFLFDWKAILETHNILRDTMFAAFDFLIDGGKIGDNVVSAISDVFKSIPGLDDVPGLSRIEGLLKSTDGHGNAQDSAASASGQSKDYSDANGVSGSMIFSKIIEYCSGGGGSGGPGGQQRKQLAQVEQIGSALEDLIPDLLTASPTAIGRDLLNILKKAGSGLEGALTGGMAETINALVPNVRAATLAEPFHIPFISDLYEWVTGDTLTLVDAACLMMAVPMNIIYGVVSGFRHFNEDAGDLPVQVRARSMPVGMPDTPDGGGGSTTIGIGGVTNHKIEDGYRLLGKPIPWSMCVESAIGALRVVQGMLGVLNDAMFAENPKDPPAERTMLQILEGLIGAMTSVLLARSLEPKLLDWLAEHGYDVNSKFRADMGYVNLAIASLGLVVSGVSKIDGAFTGADAADARKCFLLQCTTVAHLVGMVATIIQMTVLSTTGSAKDPIAAYWLYQLSQMLQTLSQYDAFRYTKTGAATPAYYNASTRCHLGFRAASLATQLASAGMVVL